MFNMQACFQFMGVNLSTIALNASYNALVWNDVSRPIDSPVCKSSRPLRGASRAACILEQP